MGSYSREQSSAASCAHLEIVLFGGKSVCGYVWLTVEWHRLASHWYQPYRMFIIIQCAVPLRAQSPPFFFISFLETEVVQHAVDIIRARKNTYLLCINKSSNAK